MNYILDGIIPVEEPDVFKFNAWAYGENGEQNRRLGLFKKNDCIVSTVFVGIGGWINNNSLFETLIQNETVYKYSFIVKHEQYNEALVFHNIFTDIIKFNESITSFEIENIADRVPIITSEFLGWFPIHKYGVEVDSFYPRD